MVEIEPYIILIKHQQIFYWFIIKLLQHYARKTTDGMNIFTQLENIKIEKEPKKFLWHTTYEENILVILNKYLEYTPQFTNAFINYLLFFW